jgi:hypothetical protein
MGVARRVRRKVLQGGARRANAQEAGPAPPAPSIAGEVSDTPISVEALWLAPVAPLQSGVHEAAALSRRDCPDVLFNQ